MNELQTAEAHSILPVERLGDTLLVTPHGDLGGYSQRVFQSEYQRVQALLDDPSLKHLIIDLSGSRYFGSEMIGALVALRERMIDRGRVALTNVSRDMLAGLDIIRVKDRFELFPTRKEAVAALATLTVGQRVQRHRRPLKWGIVLLVIAGAGWGVYASQFGYRIFGSRPARVYEELAREWTRYDEQSAQWGPDEARTYRSELLDRLASLEHSLKQSRLMPVQDDFWLQQSVRRFQAFVRHASPADRAAFLEYMHYARHAIGARTAIELPQIGPADPDAPTDPEKVAKAAKQARREIEQSSKKVIPARKPDEPGHREDESLEPDPAPISETDADAV